MGGGRFWLAILWTVAVVSTAGAQPLTVRVDFRQSQGRFERMGGVQGSPLGIAAGDGDHTSEFREHRLQLCRFPQDCEPNTLTLSGIFPDEQANPDDPQSYRFVLIDRHVLASRAAGCQVLWQASYDVGRSDSWQGLNLGGRPPQDMTRWCRVVTRCLEHFNNGWSGGHQGAVRYVEFVNEPDGLGGFTGSDRPRLAASFLQFLRAIKAYNQRHPDTPVAAVGPGVPLSWDQWDRYRQPTERLLKMLQQEQVELPIFSFHTYGNDTSPLANQKLARALRQSLDAHGLQSTRLWNSEWQASDYLRGQIGHRAGSGQTLSAQARTLYQRAVAAYVLACKIRWQGIVDQGCYYIAVRRCFPPSEQRPQLDLGIFFPPRGQPNLVAEQEKLLAQWCPPDCRRVATTVTPEEPQVCAQALADTRGRRLLISNLSTTPRTVSVMIQLPAPVSRLQVHWRQLGGKSGTAPAAGSAARWQWTGELPAVSSLFVELEKP